MKKMKKTRKRLLIVTVNNAERKAFEALEEKGLKKTDTNEDEKNSYKTYTYEKDEYQYDLIHVSFEDERQGPMEAYEVVSAAISTHQPDGVILLGTAWGTGGKQQQQLGDVLVSDLILNLVDGTEDDTSITMNTTESYQSSRRLQDACARYKSDWEIENHFKVHKGAFISYPKVIRSEAVKNKCLTAVPEGQKTYVVGGEMEATGAVKACVTADFSHYIIIKGISDFAISGGDKNAELAAKNAVSFLFYLVEHNAFLRLPKNVKRPKLRKKVTLLNEKDKLMKNIYYVSDAPKDIVLRMLDKKIPKSTEKRPPWSKVRDNYLNFKETDRWFAAQKLFDSSIRIYQDPGTPSQKNIDNPELAFHWFVEKLRESNKSVPIIFKSKPKLGKSSLMGLFYLYLLEKFERGDINFIPFYFNKESKLRQENLSSENKDVEKFFSDAENICEKQNLAALFLFDGLTNSQVFDDSVEITSCEKLLQNNKDRALANKFIFSIDDYSNITSQTANETIEDAEIDYLIYVNEVDSFKEENKIEEFIENFAILFDEENFQNAILRYKKLELPTVDFNVLSIFGEYLYTAEKNQITLTDLYNKFLSEKIPNNEERKLLQNYAYKIYSGTDLNYSSYKKYGIDEKSFRLIIEQRDLLKFLVALKYQDDFEKGNSTDEVMELLFDKQILSFVRGLFTKAQNKAEYPTKFKTLYKDIQNSGGKSSLSFLTSRLLKNPEVDEILNSHEKELDEIERNSKLENLYFTVAKRSIYISRIIFEKANGPRNSTFKYLEMLLRDSYQSLVNRAFHRYYYGDISKNTFDHFQDSVGVGFDFYRTYYKLTQKIDRIFGEPMETREALLEIHLFSLCNLFQTRIETRWVEIQKDKKHAEYCRIQPEKIKTFLYNSTEDKYLQLLNKVLSYIEKYLSEYKLPNKEIVYQAYLSYLETMRNIIQEFIELGNNSSYLGPDGLVNSISNIHKLLGIRRIGWNIPMTKDKTSEFSLKQGEPIYETVGEHILSSYWIGMLYLPENISAEDVDFQLYKKYSKQEVLNAVMIHDLGEATLDDSSPFLDGHFNHVKQEDVRLSQLLSLGTFRSFGSTFENFKLWKEWFDPASYPNINIKVAKDIDIIQRLYKLSYLISDNNSGDKLLMEKERVDEFLSDKGRIETELGKEIFKHLLRSIPNTEKFLQN